MPKLMITPKKKEAPNSIMEGQMQLQDGIYNTVGWLYRSKKDRRPFAMWGLAKNERGFYPVTVRDKFGYDMTQELLDGATLLAIRHFLGRPPQNPYDITKPTRSCRNCHYKLFDSSKAAASSDRSVMDLRDAGPALPLWTCRLHGLSLDTAGVNEFNTCVTSRSQKHPYIVAGGKMFTLDSLREGTLYANVCDCHTFGAFTTREDSDIPGGEVKDERTRRGVCNHSIYSFDDLRLTVFIRGLEVSISLTILPASGPEYSKRETKEYIQKKN